MSKVDLKSFDLEQFNIREKNGLYLITPVKHKFEWTPEEVRWRSVLCAADGTIVSHGLPKFPNLGEWPETDESFLEALLEGEVRFTEKMDGTLILVDRIDGKLHFRTRGSHDLGEFEWQVMPLVEASNIHHLQNPDYTFLFEYTGPDNRIVVAYEQPALTYIGAVHKPTGALSFSDNDIMAKMLRVNALPVYELPQDLRDLRTFIDGWRGKEGVVAGWDGKLLKIKSIHYLRLHTLRFRLTQPELLAYLLGVEEEKELYPKLSTLGVDYEGYTILEPIFQNYFIRLNKFYKEYVNFTIDVFSFKHLDRKSFVTEIQVRWPKWFAAAMKLYDGKDAEARQMCLAKDVIEIPYNSLKQYEAARDNYLAEIKEPKIYE